VGLSWGVLIVDFLLCATLTVVGRVSFRFLDDVKEKWSSEGAPAAFVGRIEDAELAFRALRGVEEPSCGRSRWWTMRMEAGGDDGIE
jgi:hypothetical protein